MTTEHPGSKPDRPKPPPNPEYLEQALTFFLTRSERRAVLAALRAHSDDRVCALLMALGIADHAGCGAPGGGGA